MRMRKKKHLEERLSECRNLIETPNVTRDYREEIRVKQYIDIPLLYGNKNPLHLEIGCGKGQFICEAAKRNPEINFLAVEINRNVLSDACRRALEMQLPNLYFLHCGAEVLPKYLKPGSVARLYLNFSCPFPKKAYENRRLTNVRYLEIYKELLAPGAEIHQKTDNMHFFEYSIEQFSSAGYRIRNISLDLHQSGFTDNILTEYEQKFSSAGFPIYRLEAFLDVQPTPCRPI